MLAERQSDLDSRLAERAIRSIQRLELMQQRRDSDGQCAPIAADPDVSSVDVALVEQASSYSQ